MPFKTGTIAKSSFLGFKNYPNQAIKPEDFNPDTLVYPCQILYSSATDYSRKVGWIKKKHPQSWFAKIINSEPFETTNSIVTGLLEHNMIFSLNPSLLDGICIGPFTSKDALIQWLDVHLTDGDKECTLGG